MVWRLAECIRILRYEIDSLWPNRERTSDGTIGDAAHATRTSDHNPWIIDNKGVGVVRAFDITHDPGNGPDCNKLANHFAEMMRINDKRISYVIWDRKIMSLARVGEGWRSYTGSNPHDKHLHISVSTERHWYDSTESWDILKGPAVFCAFGENSETVGLYQLKLRALGHYNGKIDDDFGPKTEAAVLALLDSVSSSIDSGKRIDKWVVHHLDRMLIKEYSG